MSAQLDPSPLFQLFIVSAYTLYMVAIFYGLQRWLKSSESQTSALPLAIVRTPYLVAYLRGGPTETLNAATVSLIERGFLHINGELLKCADNPPQGLVEHPLEQEILNFYAENKQAHRINQNLDCVPSLHNIYESLLALGLVRTKQSNYRHLLTKVLAIALCAAPLPSVAQAAAISSDLVTLFIFLGGASAIYFIFKAMQPPYITYRGLATMRTLKQLHRTSYMKAARQSKDHPQELLVLMAIFGLGALPSEAFAYVKQIFPTAANNNGAGAVHSGVDSGTGCGGGNSDKRDKRDSDGSCGSGGCSSAGSCGGGD